jgi:hypothetical protein
VWEVSLSQELYQKLYIYIRLRMVGISNFCNVGPGFEHWLINHATLSLALGNKKLQGKNHPCTNGFPGFPLFFANTHVENTGKLATQSISTCS